MAQKRPREEEDEACGGACGGGMSIITPHRQALDRILTREKTSVDRLTKHNPDDEDMPHHGFTRRRVRIYLEDAEKSLLIKHSPCMERLLTAVQATISDLLHPTPSLSTPPMWEAELGEHGSFADFVTKERILPRLIAAHDAAVARQPPPPPPPPQEDAQSEDLGESDTDTSDSDSTDGQDGEDDDDDDDDDDDED